MLRYCVASAWASWFGDVDTLWASSTAITLPVSEEPSRYIHSQMLNNKHAVFSSTNGQLKSTTVTLLLWKSKQLDVPSRSRNDSSSFIRCSSGRRCITVNGVLWRRLLKSAKSKSPAAAPAMSRRIWTTCAIYSGGDFDWSTAISTSMNSTLRYLGCSFNSCTRTPMICL